MTATNGIKFVDSKGFVDRIHDRFPGGWTRYLLGASIVGLGYLISRVLGHLLDPEVYLLPFFWILMASILGGLGPGLLATLLATAASRQLVSKQDSGDLWRLVIEGTLVSLVGGSLRLERMSVREHLATNLRLEREILNISDEERRRIGYDLHDRLGQQLTGISLLTETFAQQLIAGEKPDRGKLETITRLISEAVGITEDLARNLSPITLEREGLGPAILELAETTSSMFGIRCVCESPLPDVKLVTSRSIHIFRIVQEAVSNAVSHGEAKNVKIKLTTNDSYLTIAVLDDGIGISPETTARPGLGLQIMKYRATILGASLTVERTSASGGTTVICNCPIRQSGPSETSNV